MSICTYECWSFLFSVVLVVHDTNWGYSRILQIFGLLIYVLLDLFLKMRKNVTRARVVPDSFADTCGTITFRLSNNARCSLENVVEEGKRIRTVAEITSLKKETRELAKGRWNDHRRRMIQKHVIEERRVS